MSKSRIWCAVAAALAPFLSAGPVLPASPSASAGTAQLDENGRATLGELDKLLAEATDDTRKTCAAGQAPQWVAAKRAHAQSGERFADASDMCVATLSGVARDQHLLGYYRDLLAAMKGDPALFAAFPHSIAASVLNGNGKVPIGNNLAAVVTPSLALDAGFTVAWQDGTASKPPPADANQLKTIAEACLGQRADAGTCFSVGYVYGAHAFKARDVSAR